MADNIRGDGLYIAHEALATLNEDPRLLDHARQRFSEPPPSYTSHVSHNSTLSQSPDPPSEEQQLRDAVERDYWASNASNQFIDQVGDELKRISTFRQPVGTIYDELAEGNVKKSWIEQGIWDEKWKGRNLGKWKHEKPLDPESESETNPEEELPLFSLPSIRAKAKQRQPKNEEKMRQIAERRLIREREREASRPFNQFVWQVSKERGKSRNKSSEHGAVGSDLPEINTKAYEIVRNTWIERGIWNRKWGILPGMSWKHEKPLNEGLRDQMNDDPAPVRANAPEDDGYGAGGAHCSTFSQSDHQAFSISNASWQDPSENTENVVRGVVVGRNPFLPPSPAESKNSSKLSLQKTHVAIHHAELPNGNVDHSSLPSNSQQHLTESRSGPQKRRRGAESLPSDNGQNPLTARSALDTSRSSRVTKARRKNQYSQQQPIATNLPSVTRQALSGSDIPETLHQAAIAPPRRSRRLQEAEGDTAADPTDSPHGAPQSRLRGSSTGKTLSAASAKPQGVSKRRHAKTTRRRAR